MLLRQFAHECGAKRAKTLRGTTLRKHIATTCASLDLPENKIDRFASFMGHHEKIHKEIYRQPIAAVDILDTSKVLEEGLGMHDENKENLHMNASRNIKQKDNINNSKMLYNFNDEANLDLSEETENAEYGKQFFVLI